MKLRRTPLASLSWAACRKVYNQGRSRTMQISTTRFGRLDILPEDILHFPQGVYGFEHCRKWVILGDAVNPALAWMQCVSDPEVAFAVLSPRRFVPDYQVRVTSSELAPLQLGSSADAQALVIVGQYGNGLTLNLKAPIVINLEKRLGRQVVNSVDEPLQYEVEPSRNLLRRSA